MKILVVALSVLFLASCGTQQGAPVRSSIPTVTPSLKPISPRAFSSSKAFYPISDHRQCVPHARNVSGIQIRGNAHTWWSQADGKYRRGVKPKRGAVMVLSRTKRLKYGHLAVVKNIIDKRNIQVEHTNWGGNLKTRKVVYTRMPVIDISPNNDWSQVRFWNYPSSSYGRVYKNSGFIYAPAKAPKNENE